MNSSTAPNARQIIMGLLLAGNHQSLSAQHVILGCKLFGVSANNARVALARLSASGLIRAAQRGHYELGHAATDLADDVMTWRTAEQRLTEWSGDYVLIYTHHFGRTDRTALSRRQRALDIVGCRELERGLFIRPANLAGGITLLRERLQRLGLEADALLCIAQQFDGMREQQIQQLWDGHALNQRYQQQAQLLQDWMAHVDQLDLQDAARESFLLGARAIRQIVFDPLLPAPMIDPSARQVFFRVVQQFDQCGHAIWQRLFQQEITT